MLVQVVYEVVSINSGLFSGFCPLVAHVVDVGTGNEHLEIVSGRVVRVVDHEDFVVHHVGDLSGNGYNHGVVSHQTRNELGFLVVEEHLCDTAQVLSHDADAVVHVSAGQDGVGTLNIHGTYVADGWRSLADLIFVRLVLAGCKSHGCGYGREQEQTVEYSFHNI